MDNQPILLIDADPSWSSLLASTLNKRGFVVECVCSAEAALQRLRQGTWPVAMLDPAAPELRDLDLLRRLRGASPGTRFIILTGHPSQDSMLHAIREHIFDYLCKPIDIATLEEALRRAGEDFARDHAARGPSGGRVTLGELPAENRPRETPALLVGASKAIAQVRQQIAEVMPSDMTVLIRGESGAGKGVVARMIHESSRAAGKGALVKINCPAIPETLLESELFGHEAGAFTDARGRKPGRFELARGGTIFLDEIGEIPLNIQVKLLQVLEHKEFQRIGGSSTIRVDARILAATNAPLEDMIAAGQFRADLFYRLNEYCITLPPLRERPEDIPLLARHFLGIYGPEYGRPGLEFSAELMELLLRCPWRGNVRELETVIRRYALTGREESIRPLLGAESGERIVRPKSDKLRQTEIQTITSALLEARWNQRRAAGILGISYSALRRRIEKYDLKVTSTHPPAAPSAIQECRF